METFRTSHYVCVNLREMPVSEKRLSCEKQGPALGVHFSGVCIKRELTVTALHYLAFVI